MYIIEVELSAALMNDFLQAIILIVSGFFSGLFLGMGSGTTGAILITSLTVVLGHSIHQAIGTSLLIDCLIGLIAGILYFRKNNANLRPALVIGICGAIGSFLGSQFTSQTPELALILLLSTLLILLGISFLAKGLHTNMEFVRTKMKVHILKKYTLVVFILFSIIAGFGSGFTGMGIGGILALVLILFLEYDLVTAIGTSLLLLVFISGAGAVGHILKNEIIYPVVLMVGVSAAVGAVTGSMYAQKINEEKLGRLIGCIILIMGLMMLVRAFM
jgi:uncharacterized membrane protein YfcA